MLVCCAGRACWAVCSTLRAGDGHQERQPGDGLMEARGLFPPGSAACCLLPQLPSDHQVSFHRLRFPLHLNQCRCCARSLTLAPPPLLPSLTGDWRQQGRPREGAQGQEPAQGCGLPHPGGGAYQFCTSTACRSAEDRTTRICLPPTSAPRRRRPAIFSLSLTLLSPLPPPCSLAVRDRVPRWPWRGPRARPRRPWRPRRGPWPWRGPRPWRPWLLWPWRPRRRPLWRCPPGPGGRLPRPGLSQAGGPPPPLPPATDGAAAAVGGTGTHRGAAAGGAALVPALSSCRALCSGGRRQQAGVLAAAAPAGCRLET